MVLCELKRTAYVLCVLSMIFAKVLCVAGQQRNGDRSISQGGGNWYDKTRWSSSTKHQSPNSRHQIEGSGDDDSMDDLDTRSRGNGEDDEDDPMSGDEDDDDINRVGSGDRGLTDSILSSTSSATTVFERLPVQTVPTFVMTPGQGPTTEMTKAPVTPRVDIYDTMSTRRPVVVPTVTVRAPQVPVGRGTVPTQQPTVVAPPSSTTTSGKKATVTFTPDPRVFDDETTTTSRRGDRNGLEWLWSPGVLTAVIGGAVVGLLAAILLVMFIVYRMRKKDEGSYALEEPKSPPTYSYAYQKAPTREFYA